MQVQEVRLLDYFGSNVRKNTGLPLHVKQKRWTEATQTHVRFAKWQIPLAKLTQAIFPLHGRSSKLLIT